MKKIIFLSFVFVVFYSGFISSIPGIPHQFYGDVTVNDRPAPDNNIITAIIDGQNYTTITKNGKYGLSPNTFYVEDPNGNNNGTIINFYVGGKPAGTYVFQNNGFTKLDFSLTTACGDSYCLGDETCSNCEIDCGICTEPPKITIYSPENKIYTDSKIDLKVSADQEIFFWMYSLNSAEPTSFKPNITLTVGNGTHSLQIIAINRNVGTSTIQFTALVPICGDGICESENGETCSNCPQDCGVCPSSGGSSGSGGGSGGGTSGGGFSFGNILQTGASSGTETSIEKDNLSDNPEKEFFDEEDKKTGGITITGAFLHINGNKINMWVLVVILLLIAGITFIFIKKKSLKKKRQFLFEK